MNSSFLIKIVEVFMKDFNHSHRFLLTLPFLVKDDMQSLKSRPFYPARASSRASTRYSK